MKRLALVAVTAVLATACATSAPPSSGPMSFFITSVGVGDGANLGGLAGADAHCQKLGSAAGAGSRKWRAYLSTAGRFPSQTDPGMPGVNARDRIGKGPWYNAKGTLIARDLAHLHNGNALSKQTALTEKGDIVSGRGDTVNNHDILTGTRGDGTAFAPQTDTTCGGWTRNTDTPGHSAIVGHHDRMGPLPDSWATSWNFSHQSAGCSQDALRRTGGAGMFYCFASD